jgi:ubiquinone/menaquinone biosynthesis C-methylase UbiE
MDIQPAMIGRAQAKTEAAGLGNIDFVRAGAGQAKLERGRFDRSAIDAGQHLAEYLSQCRLRLSRRPPHTLAGTRRNAK